MNFNYHHHWNVGQIGEKAKRTLFFSVEEHTRCWLVASSQTNLENCRISSRVVSLRWRSKMFSKVLVLNHWLCVVFCTSFVAAASGPLGKRHSKVDDILAEQIVVGRRAADRFKTNHSSEQSIVTIDDIYKAQQTNLATRNISGSYKLSKSNEDNDDKDEKRTRLARAPLARFKLPPLGEDSIGSILENFQTATSNKLVQSRAEIHANEHTKAVASGNLDDGDGDEHEADDETNHAEQPIQRVGGENRIAIHESLVGEPQLEEIRCDEQSFEATLVLPKSFVIEPEFNDLQAPSGDAQIQEHCTIEPVKRRLYPTYRLVATNLHLCGVTRRNGPAASGESRRRRRSRRKRRRVLEAPDSLELHGNTKRPSQEEQDDEEDAEERPGDDAKMLMLMLNVRFPVVKSLRTNEDTYATLVCSAGKKAAQKERRTMDQEVVTELEQPEWLLESRRRPAKVALTSEQSSKSNSSGAQQVAQQLEVGPKLAAALEWNKRAPSNTNDELGQSYTVELVMDERRERAAPGNLAVERGATEQQAKNNRSQAAAAEGAGGAGGAVDATRDHEAHRNLTEMVAPARAAFGSQASQEAAGKHVTPGEKIVVCADERQAPEKLEFEQALRGGKGEGNMTTQLMHNRRSARAETMKMGHTSAEKNEQNLLPPPPPPPPPPQTNIGAQLALVKANVSAASSERALLATSASSTVNFTSQVGLRHYRQRHLDLATAAAANGGSFSLTSSNNSTDSNRASAVLSSHDTANLTRRIIQQRQQHHHQQKPWPSSPVGADSLTPLNGRDLDLFWLALTCSLLIILLVLILLFVLNL